MNNIVYLPTANRTCTNCSCTKAACETAARRDPLLCLIPTRSCGTCGDQVEVPMSVRDPGPAYAASCDDCGSTEGLATAEVELPENMGTGYLHLCGTCVARYDDGERSWAK